MVYPTYSAGLILAVNVINYLVFREKLSKRQYLAMCMIGVALTEGEHTVVYSYENKAFALGWKVSLVCAAVFLGLVQIYYQPDWKQLLKKVKK